MSRTKTVSDDAIMVILEHDAEPILTTAEIADQLPILHRTVQGRLDDLHEQGQIGKKKVGARGAVWWEPKNGKWVSESASVRTPKTATAYGDFVKPNPDAVDTVLKSVKLWGTGEKLERRKVAIKAALQFLVEHKQATPAMFKDEVYPTHKAGYTSAQSWWKNNVYPGLSDLSDEGLGVEAPNRAGKWQYDPASADSRDEQGRPTISR